jgi:hypothetical protein
MKVSTITTMLLFSLFAMSVLTVLLLGVSAYRNINVVSREGHDGRVGLSYIWTKVKHGDEVGRLEIKNFHGRPALYIYEEDSWDVYNTIIYHHDGWLCEIYTMVEFTFALEDGTRIIGVENMRFETLAGGVIKISAGDDYILLTPRGVANIPFDDWGVFE